MYLTEYSVHRSLTIGNYRKLVVLEVYMHKLTLDTSMRCECEFEKVAKNIYTSFNMLGTFFMILKMNFVVKLSPLIEFILSKPCKTYNLSRYSRLFNKIV